jgi:hypothetical protein
LEQFLAGLREGSANSMSSPSSISPKAIAGIQAALGPNAQSAAFAQGLQSALSTQAAPVAASIAQPMQQQNSWWNPTTWGESGGQAEWGGIGNAIGTSISPATPAAQPQQVQATQAPQPAEGPPNPNAVYAPKIYTDPETNRVTYENFPMQDIRLDQVSPELLQTMQGQGITYNSNLTKFVYGVMYKLVVDAQGNQTWQLNPRENWTPEEQAQEQAALAEMPTLNNDLAMVRQGAAEQGGDFRNPQQLVNDGDYNAASFNPIPWVLDPISQGLELINKPNEWSQDTYADMWYRKNILGENIPWYEDLAVFMGGGTTGVGNIGGSILAAVTPGTKNSPINAEGFDDWIARQDPALVKQLYEEGWDYDGDGVADKTGGAALWDAYAQTRTNSQKLLIDTGTDPLSWALPVGSSARLGARGLAKGAVEGSARMSAARGLDTLGRIGIGIDEAQDAIFMAPLKGLAKAGVKTPGAVADVAYRGMRKVLQPGVDILAETPLSRLGEDLSSGIAQGRRDVRGEYDLHKLQTPDDVVASRWGVAGDTVDPLSRPDYMDIQGNDLIPDSSRGGAKEVWQGDTSRSFDWTRGIYNWANAKTARKLSQELVGNATNTADRMYKQSADDAGLSSAAQKQSGGVIKRSRNQIIWEQNSPSQRKAARKAVEDGLDPTIPGRKTPMSSDEIRLEIDNIRANRSADEIDSLRRNVAEEASADLAAVPSTRVDFNVPLESTFQRLDNRFIAFGHQADTSRATRYANGDTLRIDDVGKILDNAGPRAKQMFYQNLADIKDVFEGRGLISATKSGGTTSEQMFWSNVAIEEAWLRAFGDQPMAVSLPVYKKLGNRNINGAKLAKGKHSAETATENLLWGDEADASKAFLYLYRTGNREYADHLESLRYWHNLYMEGAPGGQGSRSFRNMSSDTFFTQDSNLKPWSTSYTRPVNGQEETFVNPRPDRFSPRSGADDLSIQEQRALEGRWRSGETPIRQPRQFEGYGSSPVQAMQQPRMHGPWRPDSPLAALPEKIDRIAEAVESGKAIPMEPEVPASVAVPESIPDPSFREDDFPSVDEVDPRTIPDPELEETYPEPITEQGALMKRLDQRGISRDPLLRGTQGNELTEADAKQRVSQLMVRGDLTPKQYQYWLDRGKTHIEMFKHLTYRATRGQMHPDANRMFNLDVPLEDIPSNLTSWIPGRRESEAILRDVLQQSSRNDALELNSNTLGKIMDMVSDSQNGVGVIGMPNLEEARYLQVGTMKTLTGAMSGWNSDLRKYMLNIGLDLHRDFTNIPPFTGYSSFMEDARDRLAYVTRAVVGQHYLAAGKDPRIVTEVLRASLPEIDDVADTLTRAAYGKARMRRGAVKMLSDYTIDGTPIYGNYAWWDRSIQRVVVQIPGQPEKLMRSWENAARYIYRFFDEDGGYIREIGSIDDALEDLRPKTSGLRKGEGGLLKQQGATTGVYEWPKERLVRELEGTRDEMRRLLADNKAWGLTRRGTDKETFFETAGDSWRSHVQDVTRERGLVPNEQNFSKVQNDLYDTITAQYRELNELQKIYSRVVEYHYKNGTHFQDDEFQKLVGKRADDPRNIPFKRRTPMQQRQSFLLDVVDASERRAEKELRQQEQWISYYEAMGDSERASKARLDAEGIRKKYSVDVDVDRRGYVKLSSREADSNLRRARDRNRQIRRAYTVRENAPKRWLGPAQEKELKTTLAEMQETLSLLRHDPAIRYNQRYRELKDLRGRLNTAPSKSGGMIERNRMVHGYKKSADQIEELLSDALESAGVTRLWQRAVKIMWDADQRLRRDILNEIKIERENYNFELGQIRKQFTGEEFDRYKFDLDREYLGTLTKRKDWQNKPIRLSDGKISKLEADESAIRVHQGYSKTKGSKKKGIADRYVDLRMKVGPMVGMSEWDDMDYALYLADDPSLKPDMSRRDALRRYRVGLDSEPGDDFYIRQMEAERASYASTYQAPRETVLVDSDNKALDTYSVGAAEVESLPSLQDQPSLYDEAYERLSQSQPLVDGETEIDLDRLDSLIDEIEQQRMEGYGYTKIFDHTYVPYANHVMNNANVYSVNGEFLVEVSSGDIYRDISDFWDAFPELRADRRAGWDDFIRQYKPQVTGSLDYDDAIGTPEYRLSDWEMEGSRHDFDIYANWKDFADRDAAERTAYLQKKLGQALQDDEHFETLKLLMQRSAVSDWVNPIDDMFTNEIPVDEAMLYAIAKRVADTHPELKGDFSQITREDVLQAFQVVESEVGEVLDAVLPSSSTIARGRVHSGWNNLAIDQEKYVRQVKDRAKGEVDTAVSQIAEQPSPTTHANNEFSQQVNQGSTSAFRKRVTPVPGLRQGTPQQRYGPLISEVEANAIATRHAAGSPVDSPEFASSSVEDMYGPGIHQRNANPVSPEDLQSAKNTLDWLDEPRNPDTMGIMWQDPWAKARSRREAREIAEQTIHDDLMYRGHSHIDNVDDQAFRTKQEHVRRGSSTRKDEMPNVQADRSVAGQDDFILDQASVHNANYTLTADGYFKGFTVTEAYHSLFRKNKWSLDRIVTLMNKEAREGSLSWDEAKELDRLRRRFESYGDLVKGNAGKGKKYAVPDGRTKSAFRPDIPMSEKLDTDQWVARLDAGEFNLELITRKELEDVVTRDMTAHVVLPRWARVLDGYSKFVGQWARWKLLNPLNIFRFMGLNMIGDYTQMIGLGHTDAVLYSLKSLANREIRGLFRETGPGAFLNTYDTQLGRLLEHGGLGPNLTSIQGTMTNVLSRHTESSIRKIMPGGELEAIAKKPVGKFASMQEHAERLSTALEWNRRSALFLTDFQRRMMNRYNDLPLTALDRAGSMGIQVDAREIDVIFKNRGYGVSAQELYDDLMTAGAANNADLKKVKNWADRVSRDWAAGQKQALTEAEKTVNKVLFDYKMTDHDEIIRMFIPFHFWASRAIPLYAEIAVRNPYLVSAYYRAVQGMDRQREAGETPGFMDNVIEFFASPAGFMTFTNPLSAIGMISLFSDAARSEGIDDETFLGGIMRMVGDYGGMNLYPWFSAALNMTGVYGTTNRGLDPTGFSRERRLLGSIVQWANMEGLIPGMDPQLLGKPFEQRLQEGRALLTRILPGETIEAGNANASTEVSFQYIMENILRDEYGLAADEPLTAAMQEEITAAWMNPDDALYQKALKVYSNGNLNINIMNSFSPMYLFGAAENSSYLDHMTKQDQALPHGVVAPPDGDPYGDRYLTGQEKAWLDSWRRATGKDYQEGDLARWQDDTELRKKVLWLTPEAQVVTIQKYEYDNLGTASDREVWDTYNAIRWGTLESGDYGTSGRMLEIGANDEGAIFVPLEDLAGMSQTERNNLAKQWVESSNGNGDAYYRIVDLRKSYRSSHPEFNEYESWRWDISSQYDSVAAYRNEISKTNPNAARYFSDQRQQLVRQYGTDVEKINDVLDQRTTSMEAYFAIHGHRYSRSDGEPLSVDSTAPDPIATPRQPTSESGAIGEANTYLTNLYGTTVDLRVMPKHLRDPLISILPPEMQQSVRDQFPD